MQVDVVWVGAILGAVGAYHYGMKAVGWFKKFEEHVENDNIRMKLLNDALLKLAVESEEIKKNVEAMSKVVFTAASGSGDITMDTYNQAYKAFKAQGLDDHEAQKAATAHVMSNMVGEFE